MYVTTSTLHPPLGEDVTDVALSDPKIYEGHCVHQSRSSKAWH